MTMTIEGFRVGFTKETVVGLTGWTIRVFSAGVAVREAWAGGNKREAVAEARTMVAMEVKARRERLLNALQYGGVMLC